MAEQTGADAEFEKSVARIRAALDPQNTGGITSAQRELWEITGSSMAKFGVGKQNTVANIINHVGNYWRNFLLFALRTGSYRPSTLAKLSEAMVQTRTISRRMLTLNLRLLERDGLIDRQVVGSEKMNHVDYRLTPLGKEFADQIALLIKWACDHASEVEKARALFDTTHEP